MQIFLVMGYKKGYTSKAGWDVKSARVFRTSRNAELAKKNDYDGYDDVAIERVRME